MKFKDRSVFFLLFGFIRKSDVVFDSLSHQGAAWFFGRFWHHRLNIHEVTLTSNKIWHDMEERKKTHSDSENISYQVFLMLTMVDCGSQRDQSSCWIWKHQLCLLIGNSEDESYPLLTAMCHVWWWIFIYLITQPCPKNLIIIDHRFTGITPTATGQFGDVRPKQTCLFMMVLLCVYLLCFIGIFDQTVSQKQVLYCFVDVWF